jgi:hypothetical protein
MGAGRWDIAYVERPREKDASNILTVTYLAAMRRNNPEAYAEFKRIIAEAEAID